MNLTKRILGKYYDTPWIKATFEFIFVVIPVAIAIRTFGFGLYQVPSGSMETTLLVGERFFADKLSYWFRKPRRGEIIAFNEPLFEYSSNPLKKLWQYYFSWNVSNWTKRVIGIPGDHVKGVIENGRPVIYLNGTKLKEDYLNKYPLLKVDNYAHYRHVGNFKEMQNKCDYKSYDPQLPFDKQPFYKIDPNRIVRTKMLEPELLWPFVPEPSGVDVFDIILGKDEYFVLGDNRRGSGDSRYWKVLKGELIHGRILFRIWSMDTDETWWIFDLIKHPIGFWKKVRWSRCFEWVK